MLRRTRGMEGPFIILNGEDMLYPQYDLPKKLADALEDWRGWAAEEAFIRLLADSNGACPSVLAHWKQLASYAGYQVIGSAKLEWEL